MSLIAVLLGILAVVVATPTQRNAFTDRHLRIIGGNTTDITKHPYQASFQIKGQAYCEGFFISNEWILTSAYCIQYFREDEFAALQAYVGSTDLHKGGTFIPLEKRIVHPEFQKFWYINDIALVRVAGNVTDAIVKPVKLPEADQDLTDGTIVTISGWGTTGLGPDMSPTLQEAHVPIVNRDACQKQYTPNIPDYVFCAGYIETGGVGVCYGDTGSPATIDGVAVGIVNWDGSCGNIGFPDLLTQISPFRNWIRENSGV